MPDPIQSSLNPNSYSPLDGASAEENGAQACLPPAPTSSTSSSSPTSPTSSSSGSGEAAPAPAASTSPAVSSLVARFTKPSAHPPIEPSLTRAALHCSYEIAGAAVNAGAVLVTPVGLVATVLTGARAVIGIGTANRCIERDEAQQVADALRAEQSADCEHDGAMPLLKADGSVICAVP